MSKLSPINVNASGLWQAHVKSNIARASHPSKNAHRLNAVANVSC